MDIVLQSSDEYSKYLKITLLSLLKSNKTVRDINVHILSDGIKKQSKQQIEVIAKQKDNCSLFFYDMEEYKEYLSGLAPKFHGSYATYYKLFLTKILPDHIGRVLYLDVDLIVLENLEELFALDMRGNYYMGVHSILNRPSNNTEVFINGGVQLIDLAACRKNNVLLTFEREIQTNGDLLLYADQSVIHKTIADRIGTLKLRYNVVTPCMLLPYERFLWIYNLDSFYGREEYEAAQAKPVICHCTAWCVGRPWVIGSLNPYRDLYKKLMEELNIKESTSTFMQRTKWKMTLFVYKRVPRKILSYYLTIRRRNKKQGVIDSTEENNR